jgi:hypothetical protein
MVAMVMRRKKKEGPHPHAAAAAAAAAWLRILEMSSPWQSLKVAQWCCPPRAAPSLLQ